jgi:hypothetical protein
MLLGYNKAHAWLDPAASWMIVPGRGEGEGEGVTVCVGVLVAVVVLDTLRLTEGVAVIEGVGEGVGIMISAAEDG